MDFSLTLLKSLGLNIALLLSLLAIYRLTLSRWTPSHSGRQALVRGLGLWGDWHYWHDDAHASCPWGVY